MINKKEYITLEKLEAYKLARELSKVAWEIYKDLPWEFKKSTGQQFLNSTDSVGANIAEGYGRYHFLDKVKFYYNSRGSLIESRHWIEVLYERRLVTKDILQQYRKIYSSIRMVLARLIGSTMEAKRKA